MRVRAATVVSGLILGTAVSFATAAPALAVCDAYSHTCPTTPPNTIGGGGTGGATNPVTGQANSPGTVTTPGTGGALPFTGAELVLMTVVGGSAVAGGTALVLAGRRRRTAAV